MWTREEKKLKTKGLRRTKRVPREKRLPHSWSKADKVGLARPPHLENKLAARVYITITIGLITNSNALLGPTCRYYFNHPKPSSPAKLTRQRTMAAHNNSSLAPRPLLALAAARRLYEVNPTKRRLSASSGRSPSLSFPFPPPPRLKYLTCTGYTPADVPYWARSGITTRNKQGEETRLMMDEPSSTV
jgi:hypothetical protein